MIKRQASLAVLLLGLAACGGDAASTTGSASAPAASTVAKPSSTPKTEASTAPKPAEPSNEALAFKMGNKYGFAVNFSILKKQDLVDKNVALVKELAGKLGVAAPELPGAKKMPDIIKATEAELKKKSPALADAFVLGQELADQFMGANLNRTDKATLADIAVRAKGAGLKGEDVTKKHAALGDKPTPDQVTELANACAKELGISLN